jgi:hypothetical protein
MPSNLKQGKGGKGKGGKGAGKGKGKVSKTTKAKGGIGNFPAGITTTRRGLPRAVKAVRMTVAPVLACAIKTLLKSRADRIALEAHFNAIASHKLKYEARIVRAKALKAKGNATEMQGVPAHKAKITEAIGEHEATLLIVQKYAKSQGDYELRSGFSAGVGIDQIWYSKSSKTFMLVEAKGPGATLSTAAAKGDQMSKQWVRNSLNSIVSSGSSSAQDIADARAMLHAMDNGPPPKVIGKVIEALPGGGATEKGCPDKGIYHAT